MIYLHPASPLHSRMANKWHSQYGIINTPNISVGREAIVGKWALDNACFTDWNALNFMRALEYHWGIPKCMFVAVPDVVGDATKTLHRFDMWSSVVASYGYPLAFIAQNGLRLEDVPFSRFDTLFIGGNNSFKLGAFVASLVREAKQRGKWVHMGRVNSLTRIKYAAAIGCDSVDGTKIRYDQKFITKFPAYLENQQERLPCI